MPMYPVLNYSGVRAGLHTKKYALGLGVRVTVMIRVGLHTKRYKFSSGQVNLSRDREANIQYYSGK